MPGILAKQDVMDNPKKTEEGNGTTADIKFDAELLKGGEKGEEVHRLKEVLNTIKMSDCVSGEELGTQRSTTPDSVENSLSTCSTSEPETEQHCPMDASTEEGVTKEAEKKTDSSFFNIHLVLPGVASPVDIMLTSRDTVHDLLQFSLERPECCYRSCLSVRHKGKRIDDFLEIGALEDFHDGDTVELVEEPYTQRDVRMHVQRLRDLLSSDPLNQAVAPGGEGLSLSFLAAVTLTDPEGGASRVGDDLTDPTKLEPPCYILPAHARHLSTPTPPEDSPASPPTAQQSDKEPEAQLDVGPPLVPFYPPNLDKQFKFPECIKSLGYCQWNPPTNKRKMKGDLLYLEVTTLEGQEYFITACPSGFYLNKSQSSDLFDPSPRKTHHHNKHLVGLLSQISPLFKKCFAQLRKFCDCRHPFEILPVPYPVIPWVAPKPEHKPVTFKIEDSMGLKPIADELVLGQLRDWNEELQMARELPSDTVAAKVFRERTLFKIHSDFVQASVRGAMAVVDGNLPTLNPGDEPKFRMYMWNNIFFSCAFDGRDHYKEFGGDEAAHAAAAADLHGVAAHERFERKGLCTLGTVLVDYRGFRIVCQSVIPGLLQREHDAAVVYGSIDTGKSIKVDDEFKVKLSKTAEDFHIRPHKLYSDEKEEEILELPSSYEVKGIIGNDRRHYVLDLFRIYPPDANYMEVPEGSKVRHRMALLRPELTDTFLSYKFLQFLRLVREKTSGLEVVQKLQKENETKHNAALNEERQKKETEETVTPTDDVMTPPGGSKDTSLSGEKPSPITSSSSENGAGSPDSDSQPATTLCPHAGKGVELKAGKIPKVSSIPVRGAGRMFQHDAGKVATDTSAAATPPDEGNPLITTPEELYLLGGDRLEGEKDVGPEFAKGDESLDKLSEFTGEAETIEKGIEDHPEVAAAVREALAEAGSTDPNNFELRFNVDVLSPVVKHAEPEDNLEKDRKLVREAGKFLVDSIIPQFVRDCIQLSVTPLDGEALKQALHARGINMRYLGEVAKLAAKREDLQHLERLCVSEMVVRVAKRKFKKLLQESPLETTSEALVHFLNCFLGDTETLNENGEEPSLLNGQLRKKKKKKLSTHPKVVPHSKVSSQSLWNEIVEEIRWYYRYNLVFSSVADLCSTTGVQRMSLMRELCCKTGIQLVLRDYDFTSRPVFTDDDVASMYPLVKHTEYRSTESLALFELAQSKMSAGNLLLAQELFSEAIQMFIQIYGPMHVDIANCYRQAAKISQLLGEPVVALSYQHKATLIFERVLGVDHAETLAAYINLALYCNNTKQTSAALRLLYRARYLMLLVYGEDHPEMATCDSNIAVVLLSIKDYKNALVYFESTLRIYMKYYGQDSLQTALTYHLIARVHSFLGDFRAALYNEKLTFGIYNKKFGAEHERTQESSLCLKDLTGKAVTMQKTINEMTTKGSASKVMFELPGSWGEVVGMLNGLEPRQRQKPHIVRKRKRNKQQQQTSSTE